MKMTNHAVPNSLVNLVEVQNQWVLNYLLIYKSHLKSPQMKRSLLDLNFPQ